MTKSERDARQQEAVTTLRNVLSAGSTVYTVLSSVSRSGMTRTIKFLVSTNDALSKGALVTHETGKPDVEHYKQCHIINISHAISHAIADALDYRMSKSREGVTVSGCGMDMGYHVVSSLARELGIELNHRWL